MSQIPKREMRLNYFDLLEGRREGGEKCQRRQRFPIQARPADTNMEGVRVGGDTLIWIDMMRPRGKIAVSGAWSMELGTNTRRVNPERDRRLPEARIAERGARAVEMEQERQDRGTG